METPAENEKERARFEAWISSCPFEMDLDRVPDDPKEYAFPGIYRDHAVDTAWCAWQEAVRGPAEKTTSWFTFGHGHVHSVDGFTYDKDIVVEITSEDPRATMFAVFGNKWGCQYDEPPDPGHYPRGTRILP